MPPYECPEIVVSANVVGKHAGRYLKSPNFKKLNWRDSVHEICKEGGKQICLRKKKTPSGTLRYTFYAGKFNNDLCFNICKEHIDSLFEISFYPMRRKLVIDIFY